ncbi:uncharacterized protein LOC111994694 [Quercus suber]|uniref:uncharacterized protein LOC111994694 n=1 Tax=Quercus suber TaxID=58331 RepID=UPI000CE1DF53|nr:uncharacterized protein LOC111994694 [Quercus suber]POE73231.1 uncharacterized protein CFP56_68413 [Quercus suber]
MEETILNNLKHLRLTKEEGEEIHITHINPVTNFEECSLSLFGKLLSDRQQNTRALKNTLRTAWKLGPDLRIVEVGNDILQFKFSSRYQMEWVEKSGPWNFENNLLLLCRWKKGLSSSNIGFTHAPFWVQIWGLPFEFMCEEAGKDIGNKIGNFMEVDKRSWQSDQAKYMRIRVEVQLNKPLRRGGYVTDSVGSKHWVTYKYERLPTFCFFCGKLGHDIKHCKETTDWQGAEKQYGDWMRAGWPSKGGKSTSQPNRGDGQTKADGGDDGVGNRVPSDTPSVPGSDCVGGNTFSEANHSLGFVPEASVATSQTTLLLQAAENPVGWDKAENSNQNQQKTDNSRAPQRKINFGGSQTLRSEERASAPKVGLLESLSPRTQEATSPLRAKLERKCKPETHPTVLGPSNCSQTRKKVNLKKVARKKAQDDGQAHDAEMFTPVVEVGSKRPGNSETLEIEENRVQKRTLHAHPLPSSSSDGISAVAAMQHRREQ